MSKTLPPINWNKKEILIKLSILLLKTAVEIVARAVRHEKENYEKERKLPSFTDNMITCRKNNIKKSTRQLLELLSD